MNHDQAPAPAPSDWERAYLRFETPDREVRKFQRRLTALGAADWPRDSCIVEVCCGRGSGLIALRRLGFERIEGLDLSPALAATYLGPGKIILGDCRALPFPDGSRDVVVVQGGLHHLPDLPGDLERTLAEIARVLRREGHFIMVEPWLTPFLRLVHRVSETTIARRASRKVDALATMIAHERPTYEAWLARPEEILHSIEAWFRVETRIIAWGKLMLVGRPHVPRVRR